MSKHHNKIMESAVQSKRFKCTTRNRWTVRVLPGGQHVCLEEGELITTVLGSCVSACIRDPILRIGGMNHFMLPESKEKKLIGGISRALRYGNYAMDALINELIKAGAEKSRLECKFFGGGDVLSISDVGTRNAEFAIDYSVAEELKVLTFDLGGNHGRKILFDPYTGQTWRKKVGGTALNNVNKAEAKLNTKPKDFSKSKIELF